MTIDGAHVMKVRDVLNDLLCYDGSSYVYTEAEAVDGDGDKLDMRCPILSIERGVNAMVLKLGASSGTEALVEELNDAKSQIYEFKCFVNNLKLSAAIESKQPHNTKLQTILELIEKAP